MPAIATDHACHSTRHQRCSHSCSTTIAAFHFTCCLTISSGDHGSPLLSGTKSPTPVRLQQATNRLDQVLTRHNGQDDTGAWARQRGGKGADASGDQLFQVDPHALASSALGRSQKEVTKLFQQTIPELAAQGPLIVLLDEVETLVADRQKLSLEANPVDVHRATDAALAGLDLLTRHQRHILLIATTNFPQALDRAFISRADLVEEMGPPNAEARAAIIKEVLEHLAQHWPAMKHLTRDVGSFVGVSEGLDGRRIRKALIAAVASSIETARNPGKVTAQHILTALRASWNHDLEGRHEGAA